MGNVATNKDDIIKKILKERKQLAFLGVINIGPPAGAPARKDSGAQG